MAVKLDVTREHYARLESGKWKPSINVLSKISKSLGVNVEDIFDKQNGDSLDPEMKEIHEHLLMMNEKGRKRMLYFARKIMRGE